MIPRFYEARARHVLAVPFMVLGVVALVALGSCIDQEPDPAVADADLAARDAWTEQLGISVASAYAQGLRAGQAEACSQPAAAHHAFEVTQ